VQALSSTGLERRDDTATRGAVVAPDLRVVRRRPPGTWGRPAARAWRHAGSARAIRPRHYRRAAARA